MGLVYCLILLVNMIKKKIIIFFTWTGLRFGTQHPHPLLHVRCVSIHSNNPGCIQQWSSKQRAQCDQMIWPQGRTAQPRLCTEGLTGKKRLNATKEFQEALSSSESLFLPLLWENSRHSVCWAGTLRASLYTPFKAKMVGKLKLILLGLYYGDMRRER